MLLMYCPSNDRIGSYGDIREMVFKPKCCLNGFHILIVDLTIIFLVKRERSVDA